MSDDDRAPQDILEEAVRASAPDGHEGVSCRFLFRTYPEDPAAWSVGQRPLFRDAAGAWAPFRIRIGYASNVADAVYDLHAAKKAEGAPFEAVYVTLAPTGAAAISFDEDPAAAG